MSSVDHPTCIGYLPAINPCLYGYKQLADGTFDPVDLPRRKHAPYVARI
jgi:hypothetical protein